jgi:hypothetical protein
MLILRYCISELLPPGGVLGLEEGKQFVGISQLHDLLGVVEDVLDIDHLLDFLDSAELGQEGGELEFFEAVAVHLHDYCAVVAQV